MEERTRVPILVHTSRVHDPERSGLASRRSHREMIDTIQRQNDLASAGRWKFRLEQRLGPAGYGDHMVGSTEATVLEPPIQCIGLHASCVGWAVWIVDPGIAELSCPPHPSRRRHRQSYEVIGEWRSGRVYQIYLGANYTNCLRHRRSDKPLAVIW